MFVACFGQYIVPYDPNDCLSQSCKLFVDVDQKKPPYAPEETTIEVKIGQKDVTLPPNTPPPPGAPQHEFKESKLGE